MNTTNTSQYDGTIYDYVSIAETTFNLMMMLYMNHKMGHLKIFIEQGYCFGKPCCPECMIEMDDSNTE